MDTLNGSIMTLTALSGEFPIAQVRRLPYADSYKSFALKNLKRAGLIRVYSRNELRGLRLTTPGKNLLAANEPEIFGGFFPAIL